jgi:hypothetical protein
MQLVPLNSAAIVPTTMKLAQKSMPSSASKKVQVHLGGLHVTRVEQHQSRRIRLQPTSSPSNRATLDHAARQVSLLAACK